MYKRQVQNCEKLAYEYGNQEIEEEHLLYSLLTIEDSLILKLIEKMEIQKEHFVDRSKQALAKRVKVQGGQVYIGKDLNQVLILSLIHIFMRRCGTRLSVR